MFFHNFKYSFKILFRNKMLIFWTFAFPIILGIFFNMAFSNIENNEKLNVIDIAIVNTAEFQDNTIMKESFKVLSDKESDTRIFNIKYVDLEEAKILLNHKEISGYLLLDNGESKVVVKENGINSTVLKYVVEEINQTEKVMSDVAHEELKSIDLEENGHLNSFYASIYSRVMKTIQSDSSNIKDISLNNLSYTMIEFYTLIAMTCLYGGILGMVVINQNLANMSSHGKRIGITPISKGKVILSSVLASYVIQIIGISLLLLFLYFILKVNFGTNLLLVTLLTLVGCLAGLSIGIAIATLIKSNENTKTGIVISVTMLGCFLSGMMGITMKYIIDKNIPIINMINPASMITDGFYSLYYYNTLNRYWFNIMSLLIFACILIAISYIVLRRQKYDNI